MGFYFLTLVIILLLDYSLNFNIEIEDYGFSLNIQLGFEIYLVFVALLDFVKDFEFDDVIFYELLYYYLELKIKMWTSMD